MTFRSVLRILKRLCLIFTAAAFLISAIANGVATKIALGCKVMLDGDEHRYEKPWTITLFCSIATSSLLILDFGIAACRGEVDKAPQPRPSQRSGLRRKMLWMSLTSLLNVIANGLSMGSLEYLSLTVWQIARASELVFVAFFSVALLRKPLYIFHAVAIVVTIGSFLLVSWSQMDEGGSNSDLAFGLAMSLTARLFAALVGIVSQMMLQDLGMSAMRITGIQGAISTVLCLVLILPAVHFLPGFDDGRVENIIEGFALLEGAGAVLLSAVTAIGLTEIFYLWLRLEVINQSSAVFYGLLNMMRSPATFVALLGAYYLDPALGIGEPWGPRSYMIVLGLLGKLLAQLIFAERVRVPGLWYPETTSASRPAAARPAATKEDVVEATGSQAHGLGLNECGEVENPDRPLQCCDPTPAPTASEEA